MSEDTKKKKKGDTPPAGDPPPSGDATVVQMTQAELDASHTARADRAARSAVSGLLSDLGYETTDALKEALTGYTEYLATQKSESEKLTDDLATANTQVTELTGELATSQDALKEYMLRTSLMSEAREAKFLPESLDDVWMFVQSNDGLKDGLKIDDENKVNGAKAVVKKVAEKRPHWVQQETRRGTPTPRGVTGVPTTPPAEKEEVQPLVNL